MTHGIIVPILGSNIWKLLVFYEKKSHFMDIQKNLRSFYKPYDYNFKRISFKHKNIGDISILPC